ncbi:MAG: hypothetical protein A2077_03435 [Nitrospirae bacterium GWC2_46_6]|nr:MAG: hypothetical protein A2Z82_06735 [Nitrospirae bacterium GWA2_46_11]OGW22427.1 MAG: hypothetical protein A2077_03435 [Nitrospirae bacterium GWC2_46_6]OGW24717.1 MAG: hypothetical protein A2X55_06810 [Nitrospirae bacterium GWB2_47_37]HAK88449.1 hypothetical protein [Nitrospiraceae bacterium]HCZ12281.1 hypothetical protein [Nitrospiraceae bacterium]
MDKKKIAVIVRDRQSEAFRMGVGLTVLDDTIDVFITRPLKDDKETLAQLEGVKEMMELGIVNLFTTVEGTGFEFITANDMAGRLLEHDSILPY